MLKTLKAGCNVCITVTLFDGLVLARSAFHHSANYRSAVVLGQMTLLESNKNRLEALQIFMDHIAPGRWQQSRYPNTKEIRATDIFSIELDEVSVKMRAGDPIDDEADLDHAVWAGILPIKQTVGPLQDAEDLASSISRPDYSSAYGNRWKPND